MGEVVDTPILTQPKVDHGYVYLCPTQDSRMKYTHAQYFVYIFDNI